MKQGLLCSLEIMVNSLLPVLCSVVIPIQLLKNIGAALGVPALSDV